MKKQNILLKSIILLCMVTTIISCGNSKSDKMQKAVEKPNEMQEAVEKVILPQLDNPKSYEFASLQILDTIIYKTNVEYDKYRIKEAIENHVDKINTLKKFHPSESKERLALFSSNDISAVKVYTKALAKLDSVEKLLTPQINQIAAYACRYKFRANNELGNLTLHTLYMEISPSPDYTILEIQLDPKDLSSTPGDYPGKDLINAVLGRYKLNK